MSFKDAQGDNLSPGITAFQQEVTEGEVFGRYVSVGADALRNRCDRVFGTPALFRNMFFMQRTVT